MIYLMGFFLHSVCSKGQQSLIEQIDQWQNSIIEKVKQVAAQAGQQVIELMNSKWMKVNAELKSFSEELAYWKEFRNCIEHELNRLN